MIYAPTLDRQGGQAHRTAHSTRICRSSQSSPRSGPTSTANDASCRGICQTPDATPIVVEHHDRLGHFGVEQLEAVLGAQGRRIVVADPDQTTDDRRDMIEVAKVEPGEAA
jgi:hypothetical protein